MTEPTPRDTSSGDRYSWEIAMSITWHEKQFSSASDLRKKAEREDALAEAAEVDGDIIYAEFHRRSAAEYREHARLKEIRGD